MTDHDSLIKRLLTTFLREFLELFLPDMLAYTDLSEVVFLDKEFPASRSKSKKRAADLVAKVKYRSQPAFFLLHAEAQGQPQAHFNQRMFRYFAKLHDKYKLPVYPLALLTFASPRKEQPDSYQVKFPDLEVLRFNYRVIQLNNFSWRDFIDHHNPLAAALMAKMRIDKKDRPRVKAECLRMLLTSHLDAGKQSLIWEFVDTYLQLSAAEEKTFQRELVTIAPEAEEDAMELMTSWEKRGWKRGKKEGLIEGVAGLTLKLIQNRLGTLPETLKRRLTALSLAKLEQLSLDSNRLTSVADLTTWLEQHATQNQPRPNN